MAPVGKVYLVGAGPGDPGLITVRGRACVERAQVLVYDALVPPALLDLAPAGAERVFVGKSPGRHSLPQDEIQRVLIEKARAGATVVRLKGGDPLVFGRGGEEALALADAGVPFEVVPGVTAGVAAPAYAGIPVTHRGLAASVSFITGHPREGGSLGLDRLAREGTLVFYMGVTNLPAVAEELMRLGRSPDTPAAIIEWGTCARQRTITGSLGSLHEQAAAAGVEPPALVVVGESVSLRESLSWFEARPLHGLRVAVTHTRQRAGYLEQRLLELGADILPVPTVRFEADPETPAPVDPSACDWIVLTSVNAVEMLFGHIAQQGRDARSLAGVRLCVPGTPAVLEALRARFLEPDATPEGFGAEAIRRALESHGALAGKRVLLPRADIARGAIATELRAAGAQVDEWVAWRGAMPENARETAAALLQFQPGCVVFTSSAAVRHFARMLEPQQAASLRLAAVFAALGPVTARALHEHGLEPAIIAREPGLPHLVEAIVQWAGTRPANM
jgi:uroporphyrinogen III methyltransferase/synthase